VFQRALFFELADNTGNRRRLLADGDVDALDAGTALVNDRVDCDRCLAGLAAASAPGNQIYLLDLRPSLEALFAGMGRDHRSRLRGWRRAGEHMVADQGRLRAAFRELYPSFVARTAPAPDRWAARYSAVSVRVATVCSAARAAPSVSSR